MPTNEGLEMLIFTTHPSCATPDLGLYQFLLSLFPSNIKILEVRSGREVLEKLEKLQSI